MVTPFWEFAVTQGFGPTNEPLDAGYGGYAHFNKGYDYGLPMGTPVAASTGGTVISAGDAGDGWGTRVWVRDDEGFTHNYGHLSGVNVQQGNRIEAGQVVGSSGNTGKSTGPHLSYDVWDSNTGQYIDPGRFVGGGSRGPSGPMLQMPQQQQTPPPSQMGLSRGAGMQAQQAIAQSPGVRPTPSMAQRGAMAPRPPMQGGAENPYGNVVEKFRF